MTTNDRLAQHFARMRDYIRVHGFRPGYGEHGGPRCFLGTYESVTGQEPTYTETRDEGWFVLRKLVDPEIPSGAFSAPQHSAPEAMALLTIAIAMLREGEAKAERSPVSVEAEV